MSDGSRLDLWERWQETAYRAVPYLMLAVSTALAPLHEAWSWPTTPALAAVALAWLLLTQRRGPRPVHYAGLLVLIVVLVLENPLFGFFAISGYFAADAFPGRWMYLGVWVTAVAIGTSQVGGWPLPDDTPLWAWIGVVAVNLLVATALIFFHTTTEERNRRLGVLEERRRMAEEIHDTLAQGLAGIIAQLEALEHAHDRGGDWRRHLDTAAQLARESLSEARRSVHAVEPEALDGTQLPDALAEVARRWSGINGVSADVTTTGTARPMHPDVEVALLRTAQEALANVAKHARATRVGVTLSYMEDLVTLDVRDDGVGFTPNGANGGFGLTGMRGRLQRLAGTLEVESEPGAGTAVSASVPAVAP
jgi:signal transduction histidine kinase